MSRLGQDIAEGTHYRSANELDQIATQAAEIETHAARLVSLLTTFHGRWGSRSDAAFQAWATTIEDGLICDEIAPLHRLARKAADDAMDEEDERRGNLGNTPLKRYA